jgi:hypothetical protein
MKYLMMTFGSAEEMGQVASPEWIREMIAFMKQFAADLYETGELLDAQGLVDGSQARTTRWIDGAVAVTDGPFAEAKEAMVGYWVLDVESEARVLELAGKITDFLQVPIETRRIADAPPEV